MLANWRNDQRGLTSCIWILSACTGLCLWLLRRRLLAAVRLLLLLLLRVVVAVVVIIMLTTVIAATARVVLHLLRFVRITIGNDEGYTYHSLNFVGNCALCSLNRVL